MPVFISPLVTEGVILHTNPDAAHNNPTRAYTLNIDYAAIIAAYNTTAWNETLRSFMLQRTTLTEKLANQRVLSRTDVILPSGQKLNFSPGQHNLLQKAVIEQFLPRFGFNAEVLYIGDTSDKFLLVEHERLDELHLPQPGHKALPDIIAYSPLKNWVYLIEAVHSSGVISPMRLLALKTMLRDCEAHPIFVTAFLDRKTFRKFVADIAWETEVWIAAEPDHLVHFNGGKFLLE